MTKEKFIQPYIRANVPLVAIESFEEYGVEKLILEELPLMQKGRFEVLRVDARGDLYNLTEKKMIKAKAGYDEAFSAVRSREKSILIVYDYQFTLNNGVQIRRLKESVPDLCSKGGMIVLIAPSWNLPQELVHSFVVLSHLLPGEEERMTIMRGERGGMVQKANISDELLHSCSNASAGLCREEVVTCFYLSTAGEPVGIPKPEIIEREKMKLIKSVSGLEIWQTQDMSVVGGLDELKAYINTEVLPSKDDKQLAVKALLLAGIPGGGKSLSSKVIGHLLQRPVIRMSLSEMKGGLVGQSESNVRNALKLVDAIAPVVIVWDEIEKAIGGYKSSAQTDSGVTLGIVGQLLTWMQERKSDTFIVATTNDVTAIPPEMMRRFDESFFFDLPTVNEREEISKIHLDLLNLKTELAETIARLTTGWTGYEIEKLIKSAARRSARKLTAENIKEAAELIKPISVVRKDEIEKLIKWGQKSLRPANKI